MGHLTAPQLALADDNRIVIRHLARPALAARSSDGDRGIVLTGLTRYIAAMAITYSVYEAKARFSEVIRLVRNGKTVTVSYRGEPVAEIRSVSPRESPSLDERLQDLERRGALVRSTIARRTFGPVARRPGAFSRFLAERDE